MKSFKRKQNFVDKSVQGGLIRRIFLHWVIFFVVSVLAVLSLRTLLGEPSMSFSSRLAQEFGEMAYLAIIFVAIFPAFMLDTIRFSNRFVGPIVRLRRHMQELSRGETEVVKFRDADMWQPVAADFNAVRDLVVSQQQEIAELKSKLGEFAEEKTTINN